MTEAFLSAEQKLFLRTVSTFDPRKGKLKGHLIAFAVGAGLACIVIGAGL